MSGTPKIKCISKYFSLEIQEDGYEINESYQSEENDRLIELELLGSSRSLVYLIDEWIDKKNIDFTMFFPVNLGMNSYHLPREFFKNNSENIPISKPSLLTLPKCRGLKNPKRPFDFSVELTLAIEKIPEKKTLQAIQIELCKLIEKFNAQTDSKVNLTLIKRIEKKEDNLIFSSEEFFVRSDLSNSFQKSHNDLFKLWSQTISRSLKTDKGKALVKPLSEDMKNGTDVLRYSNSTALLYLDFRLIANRGEQFSQESVINLTNILHPIFKKENFPFHAELGYVK